MKYFIAFFLPFLFLSSFSQNGKLITGDCLIDEVYNPEIIEFIDSDSSGVYFFKIGTEKRKKIYYVDKYDVNSLKLIYRCNLLSTFKNIDIDHVNYLDRVFYHMLKNGKVDLIFISNDDKKQEISHIRVNADGKCENSVIAYSKSYTKDLSKQKAGSRISTNRKYLYLFNNGEKKDESEITCLKIDNGSSFSISKCYDFQLQNFKTVPLAAPLESIYGDGRVGIFNKDEEKYKVSMLSPSKRLFSKELSEITKTNDFLYDVNASNYDNANCNIKYDTSMILTVYSKKNKRYGFLNLLYNAKTGEISNNGIEYINDANVTLLKGKMDRFDDFANECFIYNQSIETSNYTYKIISRVYILQTSLTIETQSYLIALIYDKSNKLVNQKIIPFNFMSGIHSDNDLKRDCSLTDNNNINYSALKINDAVYFFTNEIKSNKDLEPDKSPIKDYNLLRALEDSFLACYKVSPNEPTKRININNPEDYTIFNIPNNFRQPKNYQYVYVRIKNKRTLGKIILE